MTFISRFIPQAGNSLTVGLISLLVFLNACAPVGPDYQPPQTDLPQSWSRTPTGTEMGVSSAALQTWWTLFDDPLLTHLLERVQAGNLDLQIAQSRIRQARAQYRIVSSRTAPQIDAEGSYTSSRKSENIIGSTRGTTQDLFDFNFDMAWEIDLFGGTRRAVEQADAQLAALEEGFNDVLISLQAEVARNYFALCGSRQLLQTSLNNIAVLEQTHKLAQGLLETGLGNQLEVVQAQTQLALSRSQLPSMRNAIEQAQFRLALLLGIPPAQVQELVAVTPLVAQALPLVPADLPAALLRLRPDIRQAERELAAANAAIGVAIADLYPSFSLSATAGLQSVHLRDLLQFGSRYWSAVPAINWSLFNRGRVRANIDLQEERFRAAASSYQQTVLTALNEVESAIHELHNEQDTLNALVSAVTTGQTAVELATGRYRSGLADLSEVLQSERTLFQLQEQQVSSRQQLAIDLVALFKALGGGWQPAQTEPQPSTQSPAAGY